MSVGRIITCAADIEEGTAHLIAVEPRFAEAHDAAGPAPLRLREDGFTALLGAIVSQQISVAAADGIWRRLEAADAVTEAGLSALDDEALRACGLSRPKLRYARALAEAGIDYAALRDRPTEEVIAELVGVKGIGIWTAEIYAMFSLGRADVLASGDLALQESARILFGLEERPTARQLQEMGAAWAPWRAVAARLLWAYYRVAKNREGVR
ncbi:DNA-3-methyladenine glycosylase family protein [Oceanomicrobium pacificus]|uniref:DNA-3-methyladenine glycosylase II n=1 Tax=Oceanomicrobium pacificus TaxID=2692916 RepID=A0A6B0TXA8_9RHOB|nr:DNA-3-methyladenine glycosylase 2 family protein [Oceanomicrobium pacificus]MXU65932.1 DNA-3-methyladenine glycosylase 2 family protein [Oceanomicrobium pacificus]